MLDGYMPPNSLWIIEFLEKADLIKRVTANLLPEVKETLRDMQKVVFF